MKPIDNLLMGNPKESPPNQHPPRQASARLETVKNCFDQLSGKPAPKNQYNLLMTGLTNLNSFRRDAQLSDQSKLQFIRYALEAFRHVYTVFAHHDLLSSILYTAKCHALTLGDKRSTAILNLQWGTTLLHVNREEESISAYKAGLASVRALNEKEFSDYATRFLILYHTLRGEPRKVLDAYEKIRTSLHADVDPFVLTHVIPCTALSAAFTGQFRLGKRLLLNGWRTAQTQGYNAAEMCLEAQLGWVLAASGDLKRARSHIDAGLKDAEGKHVPISRFWAERSFAYLLFAEGNLPKAYEQMRRARQIAVNSGLEDNFYAAPWLLEMLWAFDKTGYAPIPGLVYDQEVERLINGANLLLKGVAYRLMGMDARQLKSPIHEQLELFQKSEELLLPVSGDIQLAKTWLEAARTHMDHDDVYPAKQMISKAWQIYENTAPHMFPEDLHRLLDPAPQLPKEDSFWPQHKNLMSFIEQMPVLSSPKDIYSQLVNVACSFFGAEQGSLLIVDKKTDEIQMEATHNIHPFDGTDSQQPLIAEMARRAVETGKPVFKDKSGDDIQSDMALCIPLISSDTRRAIYVATSHRMDIYQKFSEQEIIQLSGNVGLQLSVLLNRDERFETTYRTNLGQLTIEKGPLNKKMFFSNNVMHRVMHLANLAAHSDAPITLLGETGVGKELMAKHIHEQSTRRHMPFVTVDLSCIAESLLESELFGHEKGAFTGADTAKPGCVELADKGTLFIDEIGEIPLSIQPKLLRLLQEKTYRRVGGVRMRRSDFRLVTATNRNLFEEVSNKRFREDLYHRLNVLPITIPPLRERGHDIVLLARHFLEYFSKKYGKPAPVFTRDHERCLASYQWPGNIREIKNLMQRIIILQEDLLLHLPPKNQPTNSNLTDFKSSFEKLKTMDQLQAEYIEHVLGHTGGKLSGKGGASEILGMKRTTLYNRMKKLGLTAAP